jgi:hypothetical protein
MDANSRALGAERASKRLFYLSRDLPFDAQVTGKMTLLTLCRLRPTRTHHCMRFFAEKTFLPAWRLWSRSLCEAHFQSLAFMPFLASADFKLQKLTTLSVRLVSKDEDDIDALAEILESHTCLANLEVQFWYDDELKQQMLEIISETWNLKSVSIVGRRETDLDFDGLAFDHITELSLTEMDTAHVKRMCHAGLEVLELSGEYMCAPVSCAPFSKLRKLALRDTWNAAGFLAKIASEPHSMEEIRVQLIVDDFFAVMRHCLQINPLKCVNIVIDEHRGAAGARQRNAEGELEALRGFLEKSENGTFNARLDFERFPGIDRVEMFPQFFHLIGEFGDRFKRLIVQMNSEENFAVACDRVKEGVAKGRPSIAIEQKDAEKRIEISFKKESRVVFVEL